MTFIQLGNPKNSKEEEKEALISEKKNMMNHFAKLLIFFLLLPSILLCTICTCMYIVKRTNVEELENCESFSHYSVL